MVEVGASDWTDSGNQSDVGIKEVGNEDLGLVGVLKGSKHIFRVTLGTICVDESL